MSLGNLFDASLPAGLPANSVPTPLPLWYAFRTIPTDGTTNARMCIRCLDATGRAIYETPANLSGQSFSETLSVPTAWTTLDKILTDNTTINSQVKTVIRDAKAIQIIQIWNGYVSFCTGTSSTNSLVMSPAVNGQGQMDDARDYEFLLAGTILGQASWVRPIDAGLGRAGNTVRPLNAQPLPTITVPAQGSTTYTFSGTDSRLVIIPTQRFSRLLFDFRFSCDNLGTGDKIVVTVLYSYRLASIAGGTMYEFSPGQRSGVWQGDIIAGVVTLTADTPSIQEAIDVISPPPGRYNLRVRVKVEGTVGKSIGVGEPTDYMQIIHEIW